MRFKVLLCTLLGVYIAACTSRPPEPKPLRIALRSIVHKLDPLHESTLTSGAIYYNIYDMLVRRDRNLVLRPSLATAWSTPDDLTWVFELRHGVRFSDGSPLTAADVKFSLERLKNARTQQSAALAMLDRVDILNEHRVKLITTHPSSTLLVRLADVLIVPDTMDPDQPIAGSGPFMMKSWEPGKFVHLEANPLYWGPVPSIREARFELYPDTEEATRAFLNHELDILPQIDPINIEKLSLNNKGNIVVRSDEGIMVMFLAFQTGAEQLSGNTVSGNPFRDRRVRQAVYQAVNVERIIQKIQKGFATPATQLVAPIVYGFDGNQTRHPYDPAGARKLLGEAGFPNGFDVRLDTTNNRYRMDVAVGKAIAADLREVGIRIQLNQKPLQEWLEIRQKGESPFYLAGWACPSGDSSGALDYILHTQDPSHGYGSANSGAYNNPELDGLIERCGQTMDPKIRLKLLESAMRVAMNDVASVPLYIERNLTATRSDLQWEPYPDQVIRLESIRKH